MKCKNCPSCQKDIRFCTDQFRTISWLTMLFKTKPIWCKRKYYPRYFRCRFNKHKPLRG